MIQLVGGRFPSYFSYGDIKYYSEKLKDYEFTCLSTCI